MAKRFIETGFFKSPFVRSLKAPLKTLYCFIICDCDGAGIWTVDHEIASVYIGHQFTFDEVKKAFIDSGKAIDLKDGRWFFPDFLEHQYPSGLSATNPAHKNFVFSLNSYGLLDDKLKPLPRPSQGSKVMVMVKDTVMEEVMAKETREVSKKEPETQETENFPFDDFWTIVVHKEGKDEARAYWTGKRPLKNGTRMKDQDREIAMKHYPNYVYNIEDVQFAKRPKTYLFTSTFQDEVIIRERSQKNAFGIDPGVKENLREFIRCQERGEDFVPLDKSVRNQEVPLPGGKKIIEIPYRGH